MGDAIRNNLYTYYDLQLQLDKAGGPEEDAGLFEQLILLQEKILAGFGLPPAQKHIKKLWKFANRKLTDQSVERILSRLQRAAEKHLLSPVSTAEEVLIRAEREQASAYNVLPELGFITHDYFIFIYHELLLTGKASAREVLQEMEKVQVLDCYAELYHLKHTPNPEFDVEEAFNRLAKELRYLTNYLDTPDTTYQDFEEDDEPFNQDTQRSEFTVYDQEMLYELVKEPFEVQEIVFSWDSGITLFGRFHLEHRYRAIMLGCEQAKVLPLLAHYPLGQALLPEIQITTDRSETDEPVIINLKDQYGTTLFLDEHYLEIGRYEETEDGMPENFYVLSEPVLKNQHDAQEKAEAQLLHICKLYATYIELQELGRPKNEAREMAGLADEGLFKTARLLYLFVQAGGELRF